MNAETQLETRRGKAVWGARAMVVVAVTAGLFVTSCSKLIRTGQSPSYLIMNTLQGASGAEPGSFGSTLASDVITVVDGTPTVFADLGQANLQLQLKDPGSQNSPNSPTQVNAITITQYHVKFIRSDGRNVQGVDVPFEFDGAVTVTIAATGSVPFTLVRVQSKEEAPLRTLRNGGAPITTVAEVTFFGHDQNGRDVTVSGRLEVSFANWGDPGA
jgi:hypothetical protein